MLLAANSQYADHQGCTFKTDSRGRITLLKIHSWECKFDYEMQAYVRKFSPLTHQGNEMSNFETEAIRGDFGLPKTFVFNQQTFTTQAACDLFTESGLIKTQWSEWPGFENGCYWLQHYTVNSSDWEDGADSVRLTVRYDLRNLPVSIFNHETEQSYTFKYPRGVPAIDEIQNFYIIPPRGLPGPPGPMGMSGRSA